MFYRHAATSIGFWKSSRTSNNAPALPHKTCLRSEKTYYTTRDKPSILRYPKSMQNKDRYSKHMFSFLALIIVPACGAQPEMISQVNFSDKNLKDCILKQNLTRVSEIEKIDCQWEHVKSVDEIKYFKNLKILDLEGNRELKKVDVSQNLKLEFLDLSENNYISKIDLSSNLKLRDLDVSYLEISTLDISKNVDLEKLVVQGAKFSELKISKLVKIKHLHILNYAKEPKYDLSFVNTPNLEHLNITNLPLKKLDVSKALDLKFISVSDTEIPSLDLSKNMKLEKISTDELIENLDLTDMSNLTDFSYYGANNLSDLDLSKNKELKKYRLTIIY